MYVRYNLSFIIDIFEVISRNTSDWLILQQVLYCQYIKIKLNYKIICIHEERNIKIISN